MTVVANGHVIGVCGRSKKQTPGKGKHATVHFTDLVQVLGFLELNAWHKLVHAFQPLRYRGKEAFSTVLAEKKKGIIVQSVPHCKKKLCTLLIYPQSASS